MVEQITNFLNIFVMKFLIRKIAGLFAKVNGRLVKLLWGTLSPRQKAFLIQNNLPVGKLDWDKGIIFIKVCSVPEYKRLKSCKSEPETVEWLENDILPNDVLYDVGANVGAYSFIAAKHNKDIKKVYAIEPAVATFGALLDNIVLNSLDKKIVPLNIALAERTGFADFTYSSLLPGATKHVGCLDSSDGVNTNPEKLVQPTYLWALDDLVKAAKLELPTHIKIDVDGSELGVLKGAGMTLKTSQLRLIQVEVRTGALGTESQVSAILFDNGFKLARRNHDISGRACDLIFTRD